jgi:hypothetical protein
MVLNGKVHWPSVMLSSAGTALFGTVHISQVYYCQVYYPREMQGVFLASRQSWL